MMETREANPLVSVVVPVYDVEPYLRECVDSILAQTYENLEVLLVDDGSPDGCGEICDQYADEDDRVVALHKENGGLSDARNYGLRHARGEWVSFIDSDDYVSPMFIEGLYATACAYGCSIAAVPGGKSFHDGDVCKLEEKIRPVTPQAPRGTRTGGDDGFHPVATAPLGAREALEKMLYQQIATGVQWRLYRREVLGSDPFPVGLYYEDLASTYKFVYRAGCIALLECRGLYAYRVRRESIIRQAYARIKGESAITVSRQLFRDISSWYPELRRAAASRCFSVCRMVYAQALNNEEKEINVLWAEIIKYRLQVLGDCKARKRERLAAGFAVLGRKPFEVFCFACRQAGLLQ